MKKLFIFIIVLAALLGLYFVYNYFANPEVKAPTIEYSGFKGPTSSPSVKGPSGPPPGQ
jgi:hypothetical protein